MNRIERTRLEERLFFVSHYNDAYKNVIIAVRDKYKEQYEDDETQVAKFGVLYCEALLNSKGERIPYKELIKMTGSEPTTSYYFYRKMVLDRIEKAMKRASI